ncbi:MAG: GTPase domain-containing protein [Methylococcaceae bacterium]
MLEFIQLLKQRYQAMQSDAELSNSDYSERLAQLILAEAFLRKGELVRRSLELAQQKTVLQVTVLGPTQAGKSSVVNVLLNNELAGVSPLAGYTVHAQGFCQDISLADCQPLQRYFGRFQQVTREQLSKQRFDCYSLTENPKQSPYLKQAVLWDTPDFDSIDAATYKEGVLRAIALADIIIVVLSKEKYADASVWEMLTLLEALHQPTIICLNKLSEDSEPLLLASLKEKWQQARTDHFPPVVPLYYQKNNQLPVWQSQYDTVLPQAIQQINYSQQARFEQAFLQYYWQDWLEPVYAEHQAIIDLQQLIEQIIKHALEDYQRDYLNHPHYYETFQQALAELLLLLEVPKLASLLTGTRQALTWPLRQVLKLGRKRGHRPDNSQELLLLNQLAEHVLIQLAHELLHKAQQNPLGGWWKELSSLLRTQRQGVLHEFNLAAKNYHLNFQHEIEQTAQQLYSKLQQQPLVLNSLRATRISTDAALIAMTLYTGGIGLHDLVLAPAMLTVTSFLTESAVGSYMHKLEVDLKFKQLETVKTDLFVTVLTQKLLALTEQLSNTGHFNITVTQTNQAQQQLNDYLLLEKRHGLRLMGLN